ncbi:unnamed protein product [Diatraea saccharalis]|uniref:GAR domain-containing protein n=1 Tax=Diatraea saccharalis TaxID=40085 RepID=A0A9N9QSW9_9NEOP|nr:unnamed protein product [Diatraea saccharalis]
MMVRVGGGWDTLEHFLSRHEPCQVRLVTPGRRAHTLTPLPEPLQQPDHVLSPASSKTSLRGSGTVSPVESKASSLSGKSSPLDKPVRRPDPSREIKRTSTPVKPTRDLKSTLTLPLKDSKIVGRPRKQSAPNFSTPSTPVSSARTPPMENKKTLAIDAAKKTRSASLTSQRVLCGAEKLDRPKKKSVSAATTPTEPRKQRSLSSASTPVNEPRKSFEGYAKKTRSMSVASTPEPLMTMRKSASLAGPVLTPAAIERSIRLSLEASIADDHSPKRPFLHIKAKYRSPPPREVPPR